MIGLASAILVFSILIATVATGDEDLEILGTTSYLVAAACAAYLIWSVT